MHATAPLRIAEGQLRGRSQVDAIGFTAESYRAMLPAFLPVFQGFDVAAAVQPLDLHLTDIADREIAVQRLTEKQRVIAVVVTGQAQMQALVETDQQAQLNGFGPAGKRLRTAVEYEFDTDRLALFADIFESPVEGTHQSMERGGLGALVLGLD